MCFDHRRHTPRFRISAKFSAFVLLVLSATSCAVVERAQIDHAERLRQTAALAAEVKAFGKTLGIEPTDALTQTTQERPALSMLWFWLQRMGTLALHSPIDVRLTVGFSAVREQLHLERVYRVDGYSVYYRQENEFGDERAVTTMGFAEESLLRRVKVILHEDLHGDKNFDLPWEIEEAIVTPLGSLAAAEYFRHKGDVDNLKRAQAAVGRDRQLGRELNDLVEEAERLFVGGPLAEARGRIVAHMADYPAYYNHFIRQIAGQETLTVLEAKLSHDLAYFRYFDAIVELAEKAPDLKTLIADLKGFSRGGDPASLKNYLGELQRKYTASAR